MSIASQLQNVAVNLSNALTAINAKLVEKGGKSADTIYGVAEQLDALPLGGMAVDAKATTDTVGSGTVVATASMSAEYEIINQEG